jgi:hypothetical protein
MNRKHPNRDAIISEAIKALEHGVLPRTIAAKHNIPYRSLARWLQYNLDAYRARHLFMERHLAGYTGKRRDWHKNMRLSHLSLYRQLHGMPPNPDPQYRKRANSIAIAATESSTQPVDNKGKAVG